MIIVEGLAYLTIPVTNLDASSQFYQDLFDFEVVGKKSASSVKMELEGITIQLQKVSSPVDHLAKQGLPILSFFLDVDDFTEAIAEIEEKSLTITKGPEATSDGGEFLIFKDPDGNLLEISYSG